MTASLVRRKTWYHSIKSHWNDGLWPKAAAKEICLQGRRWRSKKLYGQDCWYKRNKARSWNPNFRRPQAENVRLLQICKFSRCPAPADSEVASSRLRISQRACDRDILSRWCAGLLKDERYTNRAFEINPREPVRFFNCRDSCRCECKSLHVIQSEV